MFLDFVQQISDFMEQKPYFYRGALYVVYVIIDYGLYLKSFLCTLSQTIFLFSRIALPPVVLYISMGTLFGSGLIFATGVIYGMMSLGKK